jgi:hypothetical protein
MAMIIPCAFWYVLIVFADDVGPLDDTTPEFPELPVPVSPLEVPVGAEAADVPAAVFEAAAVPVPLAAGLEDAAGAATTKGFWSVAICAVERSNENTR